ncbi:MAG: hypothetical protein JWQ19_3890 [Subtercola sp.]|nr:hypothetical protein [Subtercola sp.]
MSKKTLNTDSIHNELAEGSVFFQPRSVTEQSPHRQAPQPATERRPAPVQPPRSGERKLPLKAYLTEAQVKQLRLLLFRLNGESGKLDRSELIGLGVELLVSMLGTHPAAVADIHALRALLVTKGLKDQGD